MLTKKVKNRIIFLTSLLVSLLIILFFIIKTLNENLLYFHTPTNIETNQKVKKNSITATKNEIKFIITDFTNEIIVSYKGSIPNLFAEGKGVVAEGRLKDKKYFIATKILAKHDENYIPPGLEEVMNKNVK